MWRYIKSVIDIFVIINRYAYFLLWLIKLLYIYYII